MKKIEERWIFEMCPIAPDWKIEWNKIYERFDWVRAMEGVKQDSLFHAEGDVLKHTKLVCENLVLMKEWRDMNETERSILFISALLHDVAKPQCTKIEEEVITSRGHAVKGQSLARRILYMGQFNIPFMIREIIVKLVRFHGLPIFFLEKENPIKAVIEASQMVPIEWLSILAKADVLGREGVNKNELLDRIILFIEFCKEQNCYESSRKFPNAISRYTFFQKENRNPDYEAFDNFEFEVILMSGLPAAGKDTWVEENCKGIPVISLDKLREQLGILPKAEQGIIIQKAKEQAKDYLRQSKPFVWNATNITNTMRKQLVTLFTGYGAKVKIVYIEAPYKEILKRNEERSRQVPEKVIQKMIEKLEIPDITEAHEVVKIYN